MGRKPKGEKVEAVQMRLILRGLMMEKFLFLKKAYGVDTNKALVEILIAEKYAQLTKGENVQK